MRYDKPLRREHERVLVVAVEGERCINCESQIRKLYQYTTYLKGIEFF